MKIEKRNVLFSELRATGDPENDLRLSGKAVTYNVLSAKHVPAFNARERIAPGAFARSIARGDQCIATWNHDANFPLARRSAGNLTLDDEPDALYFDCRMDPAVSYQRDLWQNVRNGTVQSNSFEFSLDGDDGDSWDDEHDPECEFCGGAGCSRKIPIRTVKRATLHGVNPVLHPAYDQPGSSFLAVRSLAAKKTGISTFDYVFITDAERLRRCEAIGEEIRRIGAVDQVHNRFELDEERARIDDVLESMRDELAKHDREIYRPYAPGKI
ncbi:MAG TPA: HK97 family phage prohead protease [Candidatus Acidoferrales bacterium]|nr:HK97 family phage prohead protease [Candidatus Acidoferrales bacterium]